MSKEDEEAAIAKKKWDEAEAYYHSVCEKQRHEKEKLNVKIQELLVKIDQLRAVAWEADMVELMANRDRAREKLQFDEALLRVRQRDFWRLLEVQLSMGETECKDMRQLSIIGPFGKWCLGCEHVSKRYDRFRRHHPFLFGQYPLCAQCLRRAKKLYRIYRRYRTQLCIRCNLPPDCIRIIRDYIYTDTIALPKVTNVLDASKDVS